MQSVIKLPTNKNLVVVFNPLKFLAKAFWIKTGLAWILLVVLEKSKHFAAKNIMIQTIK